MNDHLPKLYSLLTDIYKSANIYVTEYEKRGAREGLIGKTGEKPARSRHCNTERIQGMSLRNWEDRIARM